MLRCMGSQRVDSLEKTLMQGTIEGKRRRRQQRIRWLDSITNSMDMSLSKLLLLLLLSHIRQPNRLLCPLLLHLQSSQHQGLFQEVLRIRWPKYWSFSFSISPSNEYSGLISLRIDWFDLLAVQGTLKGLLQHQSSKASILQCSAVFMVQLSHPYMTTGKTTALT